MGEYYGMLTDIEKRIILSLVAIEKVTTLKLHKMFEELGSIEMVLELSVQEFEKFFGDSGEEIHKKLKYNLDFNFEEYFNYPKELFRLYDYPFVIFYRGNKELLLFKRKMSIVGSRNNTEYSEEALESIVPHLLKNYFLIVSGLAYGVDSLAHEGAIKNGGFTIGVIAHGHNIIYPEKSRYLYKELEKRHLIISEYVPTSPIRKYKFLERNRLVAGLTSSLLVTEAAKKSGTSRTVDFALDLGNNVFCLPGKFGAKMSWAMNEYIREGAILVNKLEDFGEELGF